MQVFKSSSLVTFLALIVGIFLIASGCTKPPTQEIADAEAAIAAARDAGAEEHAPDELSSAEELLAQAKSEAEDEATYREARNHAFQSKEKADLAREMALRAKAPKPVAAAAPGGLPTSHVVKRGECLWRISEYEEIYNDPFQWPLIYKENRGQIKDPDLIYPEQNFDIPRDSTESEVAEAVREAKFRGPWSLTDGK
ncbi:MAG: DUF4398 domain-containing protein [Deltaproteobacteria bacterium]|nr:MAG: DUF4398 domain-containing protein [Deltaproteobacteria bacterium]